MHVQVFVGVNKVFRRRFGFLFSFLASKSKSKSISSVFFFLTEQCCVLRVLDRKERKFSEKFEFSTKSVQRKKNVLEKLFCGPFSWIMHPCGGGWLTGKWKIRFDSSGAAVSGWMLGEVFHSGVPLCPTSRMFSVLG